MALCGAAPPLPGGAERAGDLFPIMDCGGRGRRFLFWKFGCGDARRRAPRLSI